MPSTAALRARTDDQPFGGEPQPARARGKALAADLSDLVGVLTQAAAGDGPAPTLRIEIALDAATVAALVGAVFAGLRHRDIALALGLPMFSDEVESSLGCASATRKSFQRAGLPAVRIDGKSDPRFFPEEIREWFLSQRVSLAPRERGRPRKRPGSS
jgi:hypothetical protein